jgi:predicted DNA-binding transcriptional regulator AlpA
MNDQTIPPQTSALWIRDKQAVATYGISRTKLWQLQKQGKIRSVSLTEPGMARATRLFDAKSIEAYIESFLPENQQTL